MKTIYEKEMYLVVPPEPTKEDVEDFSISHEHLAITEQEAWEKFCYPSLRPEQYKKDGFKAIKVKVKIEVLK